MRTIVLLLLVVGVIGVLALVNNRQKQQSSPAPKSSAPVQRASLENVDVKVSWRKTSTNMMIATFAVTNRNNHSVKDLDVECTMYTPGGTALGEARRTVYDVVPAAEPLSGSGPPAVSGLWDGDRPGAAQVVGTCAVGDAASM